MLHYAQWIASNKVPYKDVLHKVGLPTETWPAQDIRKCHVMHIAAICSRGDQQAKFARRAEFFCKHCLEDLLSVVMEDFGITRAFAFDQHFGQFGTVTVVP